MPKHLFILVCSYSWLNFGKFLHGKAASCLLLVKRYYQRCHLQFLRTIQQCSCRLLRKLLPFLLTRDLGKSTKFISILMVSLLLHCKILNLKFFSSITMSSLNFENSGWTSPPPYPYIRVQVTSMGF